MSNFSDKNEIRVGIVDDSPLVREIIESVVNSAPGMKVAGMAGDPYEAREMIKSCNPDVLTLDIEMPRMDGLEFLEKIMRLRPMPVIMVSTLTTQGGEIALRALELGAIDYIGKPVMNTQTSQSQDDFLKYFRSQLIPKLKAAHESDLGRRLALEAEVKNQKPVKRAPACGFDIIGIASSTGGIERLRYLFSNLRCSLPPVLIVQHIHKNFVQSMAQRMQTILPEHLKIEVARHRSTLQKNTIYLADNLKHLSVKDINHKLSINLIDKPARNGFVASADYLFESMSLISSKNRCGIIISGMGNDGAKGLLELKQSGALTLGESEESCMVYGMPRAAEKLGALKKSLSMKSMLHAFNSGEINNYTKH